MSTATSNQGMLVPYAQSGGTDTAISQPVARLLKVNSSTKLTIGGLTPAFYNAVPATLKV